MQHRSIVCSPVPANGTETELGRAMPTSSVPKEENCRRSLVKISLDLGGVGGNGGDVCNVVAFFEGWDRVDV